MHDPVWSGKSDFLEKKMRDCIEKKQQDTVLEIYNIIYLQNIELLLVSGYLENDRAICKFKDVKTVVVISVIF